ncbi:MAG TPA: cytochrome c-type biogenesis protein CcmH [Anaerolineales bacterium]
MNWLRSNRKWVLITFVILSAALFAAATASAQQGQPPAQPAGVRVVSDNEVNAVAKKLYCPVCPNTPLDVCETQACKDWRAQIRDQLSKGWSEKQILDYFVQQYGERVLGEPERRGFTSMVWVLPVIGVLLGALIVWQVVRGWLRGKPQAVPPPQPALTISAELRARIEKELKEVD